MWVRDGVVVGGGLGVSFGVWLEGNERDAKNLLFVGLRLYVNYFKDIRQAAPQSGSRASCCGRRSLNV